MISFHFNHRPATASTNDDALTAAEAGEAEGLVITAAAQTGGRGRRGRSWVSPPGNLYASLLLRPSARPDPALYGFVIALAIAGALRQHLDPTRVRLKWPNDVLVDGGKISGILLESAGTALVIGFGVNIASHPDNARYPATSLAALGFDPARLTPQAVLQDILAEFTVYHDLFTTQGFAPIREAWLAQAAGLGEPIYAVLPDRTLAGLFMDIDAQGHLLLKMPEGNILPVAAGDVFPTRSES